MICLCLSLKYLEVLTTVYVYTGQNLETTALKISQKAKVVFLLQKSSMYFQVFADYPSHFLRLDFRKNLKRADLELSVIGLDRFFTIEGFSTFKISTKISKVKSLILYQSFWRTIVYNSDFFYIFVLIFFYKSPSFHNKMANNLGVRVV